MAKALPKKQAGTTWAKVYRLVKSIPRGRVITYGSLARMARLRGGAREAGHAMGATPKGQGIPWHRVVGANGRLLIREGPRALQLRVLQSEGVAFTGLHVDMAKCEWKETKRASATRARKPARRRM